MFNFIFPKDKDLFKYIFTLAFPVIISNISRVMMGLIDTIMVGHLGAKAIAGVGIASMVTWTFLSLGIAFRTGTQTIVSRRLGQKKYSECGTAFRNMQVCALLVGIPLTYLSYIYVSPIMFFFIKDLETHKFCVDYATYIYLSIWFIYSSFIFQGFYTGIEKTKIHMRVVICSNLINLYLNIGLIFGLTKIQTFLDGSIFQVFSNLWIIFPFPELGVKGAAIGTFIATIWGCFHYLFYLFNEEIKSKYEIFKTQLNKAMLKRQILIAYPIALQETLVMFSFTIFYKIMGTLGAVQLAATHIIFKIMHASFMPAIGIGQACATLVGKFLGEENPDKAERAINESLRGSLMVMGTVGLCFILFAEFIIPLFITDPNVIKLAVPGLRFVGLLQFADAVCFTTWFALTGAGDTKIPALVDVLTHWVLFIPACYLLSITFGYGYWGGWISFGLHLIFFACFIYYRFKRGYWKTIKV